MFPTRASEVMISERRTKYEWPSDQRRLSPMDRTVGNGMSFSLVRTFVRNAKILVRHGDTRLPIFNSMLQFVPTVSLHNSHQMITEHGDTDLGHDHVLVP